MVRWFLLTACAAPQAPTPRQPPAVVPGAITVEAGGTLRDTVVKGTVHAAGALTAINVEAATIQLAQGAYFTADSDDVRAKVEIDAAQAHTLPAGEYPEVRVRGGEITGNHAWPSAPWLVDGDLLVSGELTLTGPVLFRTRTSLVVTGRLVTDHATLASAVKDGTWGGIELRPRSSALLSNGTVIQSAGDVNEIALRVIGAQPFADNLVVTASVGTGIRFEQAGRFKDGSHHVAADSIVVGAEEVASLPPGSLWTTGIGVSGGVLTQDTAWPAAKYTVSADVIVHALLQLTSDTRLTFTDGVGLRVDGTLVAPGVAFMGGQGLYFGPGARAAIDGISVTGAERAFDIEGCDISAFDVRLVNNRCDAKIAGGSLVLDGVTQVSCP